MKDTAIAILVVEDNEPSLILARDVLTVHGFRVYTAVNGLEAIEVAMRVHPALIFMDIQMPMMSGLEATQRLKSSPQTRAIPIVVLSASAMPDDIEQFRLAGCDGFLAKPAGPVAILDMARKHLRTATP